MKASAKAFGGLVLVMLVVMTLFFILSTFRFQATLNQLVQSRLTVVGQSIADSLEAAVDLGLGLYELRTADLLINRAKENDPGIEVIDVFDPGGQILYSTAQNRAGDLVEPEVLTAQDRSGDRTWALEGDTVFSSGVTLTDSIGQAVGGVLFTYSKTGFNAKVTTLRRSLIRNIGVIVAIFAVITYVGIRLGFRYLDRYMVRIDDAMDSFPNPIDDEMPEQAVTSLEDTLPDPDVVEEKLRVIARQISEANREINALERTTKTSREEEH